MTVKFRRGEALTEHFRELYPVIDVDGVRVLFPHGWGLARASNTQPVLFLRFEAPRRSCCANIRRKWETAVEQAQTKKSRPARSRP